MYNEIKDFSCLRVGTIIFMWVAVGKVYNK